MKKVLTVFLCIITALSVTACSADKEAPVSGNGAHPEESISSDNAVSGTDSAVSLEEITEYRSLTVLGDSIASGCMLPQYEPGNNYSAPLSFGNMLGEKFENYQNFAVDGRTTDEMLKALEASDGELFDAISSADVTVISIGGNDFLQPMIAAMLSDSELIASMFAQGFTSGVSEEYFQKALNSALEAAKNVDVTKTLDNISKCVRFISDINPDTEIILMTVYDPFSGNELLKAASEVAQEKLSLLNFGLMSMKGGKVSVIDVYTEFSGKADKYTNITFMDIHPNSDGHRKIYELLKKQLKLNN